jgi:hypothetical protein
MKVLKDTFNAWIDKQPVGPHKLIVIGAVQITDGGNAKMTRAVSQGINPNIIILELNAVPPTGRDDTNVPVRYEESPPKAPYTEATIRYGNEEFTIPVTETH